MEPGGQRPEEDEGQDAETSGSWYFDLPSGAWERQEAKNRELRQRVQNNLEEAPPRNEPFVTRHPEPEPRNKGGRFGFGKKKPQNQGSWESAGGTYRLRPGNVPGFGDVPLPAGDADEWSTESSLPLPLYSSDEDQIDDPPPGFAWDSSESEEPQQKLAESRWASAPAGALPPENLEEEEGLAAMRAWAMHKPERHAPEPHHAYLRPVDPEPVDYAEQGDRERTDEAFFEGLAESTFGASGTGGSETGASAIIHAVPPEDGLREAGPGSRWNEMFARGAGEGGLAAMAEWAKLKPDPEPRVSDEIPEEFLKPFDWENEPGTSTEAPAAEQAFASQFAHEPDDGEGPEDVSFQAAAEMAEPSHRDAPEEMLWKWSPSTMSTDKAEPPAWAMEVAEDEEPEPVPAKKRGLFGRLLGRDKNLPGPAIASDGPPRGGDWLPSDETAPDLGATIAPAFEDRDGDWASGAFALDSNSVSETGETFAEQALDEDAWRSRGTQTWSSLPVDASLPPAPLAFESADGEMAGRGFAAAGGWSGQGRAEWNEAADEPDDVALADDTVASNASAEAHGMEPDESASDVRFVAATEGAEPGGEVAWHPVGTVAPDAVNFDEDEWDPEDRGTEPVPGSAEPSAASRAEADDGWDPEPFDTPAVGAPGGAWNSTEVTDRASDGAGAERIPWWERENDANPLTEFPAATIAEETYGDSPPASDADASGSAQHPWASGIEADVPAGKPLASTSDAGLVLEGDWSLEVDEPPAAMASGPETTAQFAAQPDEDPWADVNRAEEEPPWTAAEEEDEPAVETLAAATFEPADEDDPWSVFIASRSVSAPEPRPEPGNRWEEVFGRTQSTHESPVPATPAGNSEGAATGTEGDDPWAAITAAAGYDEQPGAQVPHSKSPRVEHDIVASLESQMAEAHQREQRAAAASSSADEPSIEEPPATSARTPSWDVARREDEEDVILKAFERHAATLDSEPAPAGQAEVPETAFATLLGDDAEEIVAEGEREAAGSRSFLRLEAWAPQRTAARAEAPAAALWEVSDAAIGEHDPTAPFAGWGREFGDVPPAPPWDAEFDHADAGQSAHRRHSRAKTLVRELVETGLLALLVFLAVRASFQNFKVDGSSMYPTLENGQFLIVNKLVYSEVDMNKLGNFVPFLDTEDQGKQHVFHGPERGDIVVLIDPRKPDTDLIKRIIGLPGETVEIADGHVYINDRLLEEPYIKSPWHDNKPKIVIPLGEYYVLGDNRDNSLDSRSQQVGLVPKDLIIGKAMLSYWPTAKFGLAPNEAGNISEKDGPPRLTAQRIGE